jgi:hypothetical protein
MALCADLATLLAGLERLGYQLRGGSGATSLHGRIGTELPRYLHEGRAPFADWHNGVYVLESLPCARWCFLHSPEDFEQTLFTVVDAGHDADTVAAMACTVSGAYRGNASLPARFLEFPELQDGLVVLLAWGFSLTFIVQGALRVPIEGSVALFLFCAALHLFATTSMGIFMATLARSMPQFGLLMMLTLLPLQMLSGGTTPRESMPAFAQNVMLAAPTTHFVSAAQAILYRGAASMSCGCSSSPSSRSARCSSSSP